MSNSTIFVAYGDTPYEMTLKVLKKMQPFKNLDFNKFIGIKPNLVKAKTADSGATTSPEIVRAVIEHLRENDLHNIAIMEGCWIGTNMEKVFKASGYDDLARELNIPLINLQKDKARKIKSNKKIDLHICEHSLAVDYMVNIPVLKAHCQTKLTCALKNMKGCIPDNEKRRFHSLGLHEPIAHLNNILKNDLIIVDGIMGDLTHEEGGNPVEMGRIIAGYDPVMIDSYAARLIGYEVQDIPYIEMAADLGVGKLHKNNGVLEEIDPELKPALKIEASNKAAQLAQWVEDYHACSPCFGSTIHALQRLEDEGKLQKLNRKIHVGRGFQDTQKEALGIGLCTQGFSHYLPGCPPESRDIVQFLLEHVKGKQ